MPYERSRYKEIIHGLVSLAQTMHDAPANLAATGQIAYVDARSQRAATKVWEVPSSREIMDAGGTPFLAVRYGKLEGYGLGGVLQSADMAAKGPSTSEPYRTFEVFSIHPFDAIHQNYDDAADDMTLLEQTFNDPANGHLGGLCQDIYVSDSTPAYIELVDGSPFTAAYLVVRVLEVLYLQ